MFKMKLKIFSKELKGISDGQTYSTSKGLKGNAITHPQSHPI